MSFETLGLHPLLLKALTDVGYQSPTTVQEQAIPAALRGEDLLVSSQTGSGKTAAFMLPALHRFTTAESITETAVAPTQERSSSRGRNKPRFKPAQPKMLVLIPTRELALQITTAIELYSKHLQHRVQAVTILGGMPYARQLQLLSRSPEILVATPGRLIDHMGSGKIDFSKLEILVLDEADRMLDMGFIDDIESIIAATPENRQTMLFSATLSGVVGNIAKKITRNPLVIEIASATTKHENILQHMHFVDDLPHKNRLLDHLLRDVALDQALVFTATKRDADIIADRLKIAGHAAAALHGGMHQGARNRTLDQLRRGGIKILVATDVAARGIDVPNITHVFNYDLPKFPEDYVHRIGRTGRGGRNGRAISLVNHAENINVKRIEKFTKQLIAINIVEGFEPQKKASPSVNRKMPGSKPGRKNFSGQPSQRTFSKPGAPKKEGGYSGQRSSGPRTGAGAAGTGAPRHASSGARPSYGNR